MWAESTAKAGVNERRISSIYTFNFETKSILSDRAWVNLESSGIFFCVFLGFGYKITDKPWIPSDNLDPASTMKQEALHFVFGSKCSEHIDIVSGLNPQTLGRRGLQYCSYKFCSSFLVIWKLKTSHRVPRFPATVVAPDMQLLPPIVFYARRWGRCESVNKNTWRHESALPFLYALCWYAVFVSWVLSRFPRHNIDIFHNIILCFLLKKKKAYMLFLYHILYSLLHADIHRFNIVSL